MRIAVGGIHTECSTYSPLTQVRDDFSVLTGADLLDALKFPAGRFDDVAFLPLFHARSVPGGPVSLTCYQSFKSEFLNQLSTALPVDGVLLIMHGAMHVPGLDDPEGDWIGAVRELVGQDIPITVSFDLHGNVTQRIVDAIDGFAAYRTAPHIDVQETHLRAADLLVDHLRGGPRPLVAWVPVPVLLPGEKTSTEDEPTAGLYRQLPAFDQRDGVLDANLMVGYVWADTARATAAAVVSGTNRTTCAKAAEEIAALYWAERETFTFGVPALALDDCLERLAAANTGPLILADSGDNPTGGGVGDRADVLKGFSGRALTGAVFAGIAAPEAARAAASSGAGTTLPLAIGNELGSDGAVVTGQAKVLQVHGPMDGGGLEVLIEMHGNRIVLTERRRPFHRIEDIETFAVKLDDIPVLVVKSGYLSPELAPRANPPLMALTDGAVNQDIPRLANHNRSGPVFPFDIGFAFTPAAKTSRRATGA